MVDQKKTQKKTRKLPREVAYNTPKGTVNFTRDKVLGQPVDLVTYQDVLTLTEMWLTDPNAVPRFIFAQNPEKVLRAGENMDLQDALLEADLLIPDGTGVVWALRRKGHNLPGRVTGIDLLHYLLAQAETLGVGVYFLGGQERIVSRAVRIITHKFPDLKLSGYHHGYFSLKERDKVLSDINHSGANLLFAAMGSPKQEIFLANNRAKLSVHLCMGIGGSLDVIAGEVKRAPELMQKLKLEWLYRVVTDPKRINRGLQIPRFITQIIFDSRQD